MLGMGTEAGISSLLRKIKFIEMIRTSDEEA